MTEQAQLLEPWQPATLEAGRTLHWQIGPLKIWLTHREKEWMLASQEEKGEEEALVIAEHQEAPEDVEWRRWAGTGSNSIVQLTPVMPDRPVVIRPRNPLTFPPGAGGTFYARIPVFVRVTVGQDRALTLCDIPSVTLSNTWFGVDTTEGELCYAMRSTAPSQREEVIPRPHRAVCTLRLRNTAEEPLDFQRICLRVEHVTIYGTEGCMWSSEVSVSYRGQADESKIRYIEEPFKSREGSLVLGEPRTPPEGGMLARSFAGLLRLGNIF